MALEPSIYASNTSSYKYNYIKESWQGAKLHMNKPKCSSKCDLGEIK